MTSRVIYFNSPVWSDIKSPECDLDDTILCVDGLQRLTSLRRFLNNEIPIFGTYFKDFEDNSLAIKYCIKFNINCLQTRKEVLQWYLDMNSGGTPHSADEIERVQNLMSEL